MREDVIHLAVRLFLRGAGWQLIAGQFPDGSDELPVLNIMDPTLACDNSPDHRRHSMNKFVPDLVAYRGQVVLVVEMKPSYSSKDERKLEELLTVRRHDLLTALKSLVSRHRIEIPIPVDDITFIPCLGFHESARYIRNPFFCYFKVKNLTSVIFEGNTTMPDL